MLKKTIISGFYFVLLTNILQVYGCGDGSGPVLAIEGTPVEITADIDDATVLSNVYSNPDAPDYLVNKLLFVRSNLTVEPGVRIAFTADSGLTVSTTGSIKAVGTSAEPCVFTGEQAVKGFWRGLNILSNDTNNELVYCVVEYGGGKGFDGADLRTNIMVANSGRLKMENSISRSSAGYGIYTRGQSAVLDGFANNILTTNEAPAMTFINHYHYFDSGSDYTGNTKDYIDSDWSSNPTSDDVTWQALNVPYRMAPNIEKISSAITIEAGAQFLGQSGGGLSVDSNGSLNAVGSSDKKISFSGEQNTSGYWRGIRFLSNNTNNELTHVIIADGGEAGFDGANLKTNIMVSGSGRLKMTNTTSRNSGGYGLYTRALNAQLADFENNTITENEAPVMTIINHYQYFDSGSDFTGNTKDYIDSEWSSNPVDQDATWMALNVPYRLASNIEKIEAAITIEPGARFIGQFSSGISVTNGGTLKIVGTSEKPITFKGEQNVVGYWRGLRYNTKSDNNLIAYTIVSNGGEQGFDGGDRRANIEVLRNASLTMNNSTSSNSGGYGLGILNGGSFTESGNTYTGNTSGDVYTYP